MWRALGVGILLVYFGIAAYGHGVDGLRLYLTGILMGYVLWGLR